MNGLKRAIGATVWLLWLISRRFIPMILLGLLFYTVYMTPPRKWAEVPASHCKPGDSRYDRCGEDPLYWVDRWVYQHIESKL
jgi:hypothetical protein